jgi:hypothetical protein
MSGCPYHKERDGHGEGGCDEADLSQPITKAAHISGLSISGDQNTTLEIKTDPDWTRNGVQTEPSGTRRQSTGKKLTFVSVNRKSALGK